MTQPKPLFDWSGKELANLSGIVVYAWRRGEDWLYVGLTSRGMSRFIGHHAVGHFEPVEPEDRLLVWPFAPSEGREAQLLEAQLIQAHAPRYNFVGIPKDDPRRNRPGPWKCELSSCGKEFWPKRWWQKYCSRSCTNRANTAHYQP